MEIVYSSRSALQRPSLFFAEAGAELRGSFSVAGRLFRSNLQARHRRAWLGYLWLLLPTLATTLVWVYVQSRRLIAIAPTTLPYPVFVLAGTIFWQVFVDALNAPLQQLAAGRQLITRSRVPHEALILAGMYEVFLNCAIRTIALAAVLIAFRVPVGPTLLGVPAAIAALASLGLTLGLFAAPLGMLYDDVSRGLLLVTGFWFFLTPVIYPTPAHGILRLNPVTPLLDTARNWLTGGPASDGFAIVAAATIPAVVAAWLLQRLARPHVVERLG